MSINKGFKNERLLKKVRFFQKLRWGTNFFFKFSAVVLNFLTF